jgi:imidazolonepropionase-like amidohydrolase
MMRKLLMIALPLAMALPLIAMGQGMPFGQKKPVRPDSVLIIHAGTLLAVPGESPVNEHSIIVRNDLVSDIRSGYVQADQINAGKATVEVVDLKDHFVMPGLFDSHVHLSRATGSFSSGSMGRNNAPAMGEATANAMINVRLNLAAGFTALRDLGSDQQSVLAVRDAINAGNLVGPTVIASGTSVSVTAGHGDDSRSGDPDERARAGVCDGADECRRLVRHLQKNGSDLIKFKATGGFSSNTGLDPHMTVAEMSAIIDTAHMRNMRVTTHAYDAGAIENAVEAGVDSVEHGFLISDKGLRMMKRSGAFLVPTVTIAQPPSIARRFMGGREAASVTMRNEFRAMERAFEMGVKVAFGTDTGIYPHGENADELITMVGLGISPSDALRSATVVAAELFNVDGLNGIIGIGDKADIIAVSGNPLSDIAVMKSIDWVIKGGLVAKRDGVMTLPIDYSLPQKY